MNKYLPIFIILIMASSCKQTEIEYPETRKDMVSDYYFDVEIEDPYRWLEDDNSEETKEWVKAQNKVTFAYLESLPYRDKIEQRITELYDYPRTGTPFSISGKWFVFKNDGLQNQSVLYIMKHYESEPRLLLDPNLLSDDGTVALTSLDVSACGKLLVYSIARSGSDWNEIFVMNIDSGEHLDEHIKWVKFSRISCYNNGFFYSAYDEPQKGAELSEANTGQKIFFHQFGTNQAEDKLIYANPDKPARMYRASIDENKKYLFISESESTSGNGLYMKKLGVNDAQVIQLAEGFQYNHYPIEIINNKVLVLTNNGAPRYRLVAIDPQKPSPKNWEEIIPEKENTLSDVSFAGQKLFASYMVDAKSKIEVYTSKGEYVSDVDLPGICTASSISGTFSGNTAFYSYSSFNTPGTIIKYDIENHTSEVFFEPEVSFNPDDFVVKQEFYTSADGTKIPMFIVHKKGIEKNGKNPAMLYAYGGFNISITPSYSAMTLYYLENGGIYASANIRGGGEYGKEWHQAGTLIQKQNVFDDFIAAAEYLIAEGYTNPEQLAIRGGSNGGLLVGAVTNQRPDLFKVALPAVGVLDMLRYHKFTIGYAWATDYGRSDDSEEMFRYLLSYSPLHNIEEKDYPAILVTTADHDDRVVPAHSFKYIATMQEKNTGKLPTLIRIDVDAGHGSGKPTSKIIEEFTDMFAFVFYHTGIKPK